MARTSNPRRKPWPSTKNVGESERVWPSIPESSKRARQSAADLAALRADPFAATSQGRGIGIKEAEMRAFRDKVTEDAARAPKPERTTFKSARREDDSIAGLAEVTTSRARTMREADQKQARVERNLARLRSGGQGRSDMVRRAAPPSGRVGLLDPYSEGAAPGPYALGQAPAEGGAAPTPTDPRVAQLAALRKAQKGRENSPFLKGTVSDRRFEANRAKIADIEGAQLAESRAAPQRQQGIDEQRTALDEASKRRIGEAEAIAGFTAGREEASDTRRATRETQAQEAKAAESRFLASQKLASVEQQNDYINKSQENAAVFQNASNMLSNLGKTIYDEENKEGNVDTVRLKELKEQQSLIRDGLLLRMKEQGFVVKERADKGEKADPEEEAPVDENNNNIDDADEAVLAQINDPEYKKKFPLKAKQAMELLKAKYPFL